MGADLVGPGIAYAQNLGSIQRSAISAPLILVADVVNGALESRYSALRQPGAAGGYQVTAGKTLLLTRTRFYASTANAGWLVLSGTADAGDSQVAAPAGAQSENSRADGVPGALNVLSANNPVEFDLFLNVTTGRYPAIRCMAASTSLFVFCVGIEI